MTPALADSDKYYSIVIWNTHTSAALPASMYSFIPTSAFDRRIITFTHAEMLAFKCPPPSGTTVLETDVNTVYACAFEMQLFNMNQMQVKIPIKFSVTVQRNSVNTIGIQSNTKIA